jgi:hypothetical protein
MEKREALEALSTRKLANGGQTSGVVAAHSLASRFCFCSAGKRNGIDQSRHRDLLKTKAETIEPMLDAAGGGQKERCYLR